MVLFCKMPSFLPSSSGQLIKTLSDLVFLSVARRKVGELYPIETWHFLIKYHVLDCDPRAVFSYLMLPVSKFNELMNLIIIRLKDGVERGEKQMNGV